VGGFVELRRQAWLGNPHEKWRFEWERKLPSTIASIYIYLFTYTYIYNICIYIYNIYIMYIYNIFPGKRPNSLGDWEDNV
jgi:hypothetical protein